MREILIALVFLCIWLGCWVTLAFNDIRKHTVFREQLIGTEIVVCDDTLMVVDWVFWGDDYKLSNGLIVESEFIQLLQYHCQ